eukprot:gene8688-27502_t
MLLAQLLLVILLLPSPASGGGGSGGSGGGDGGQQHVWRVIAERYATQLNQSVLVLEKRGHIGGNCYDYVDEETGIRVNQYGAHLFHTKHKRVWDYLQQFSEWVPYEHKVLAFVEGKHVPIPVNIDTVNALFGLEISTEAEMDTWLRKEQVAVPVPVPAPAKKAFPFLNDDDSHAADASRDIVSRNTDNNISLPEVELRPKNSEETALSRAKTPAELGPEVLARIPVRNNHDARYFSDPYQALPKEGYTAIFERMFSNPLIDVQTNTDYFDVVRSSASASASASASVSASSSSLKCGRTFFTGPIDEYYAHLGWPKLEYRSLDFERKVVKNVDYFQPNSVVNHPSPSVAYTRIVEYKHMLNQSSPHTVVFYERSKDGDGVGSLPYYPVPTTENKLLYAKYQTMADKEPKVTFVGRLANYKYFNMDETVKNALELFDADNGVRAEVHVDDDIRADAQTPPVEAQPR